MLEIPTIRKSTFKVQELNKTYRDTFWYPTNEKGDKFFRNCFISPSGEIEVVDEDWHHIEKALEIIQRLDAENSNEIKDTEECIWRTREQLKSENSPWLTESQKNIKRNLLAEQEEKLRKLKEIHIEEDFKAVNRNRGFDAGEFLVIYRGYIALSDFNIVYLSTTRKQRELLNVVLDKDENGKEILKPLNDKQLAFKSKRAEIINRISKAIRNYQYYTDNENAFHCPSGIPRMGWDRLRSDAIEEYSRISSEEYKKEISKYGLQFPRLEREYFSGRIYTKIDENSFFIPGVNRELYEKKNR